MTEYEMVGWHHPLNGNEFEQDSEVGDGQVSACSLVISVFSASCSEYDQPRDQCLISHVISA